MQQYTGMHRDRGRADYDYDYMLKRHKEDRYRSYNYSKPEIPVSEQYRSVCIYGIDPRLSGKDVEAYLYREYERFGEFNVKIVNTADSRLAFLNFKHPDDAKEAKRAKRPLAELGAYVRCEAVYPKQQRSQSPPDYRSRSDYPPPVPSRSREPRDMGYYGVEEYERYYDQQKPPKDHKFPYHLNHVPPEDDPYSTRTLFVGNVDRDVSEDDLRAIFERYGSIEEIDIKRPPQGNAFAFIKFLNVDMAHRAKVDMSGRYIGGYQCKIGYGKPMATNCLWVGGLGPWVRAEVLEREFDRFGAISRIEWPHGKGYAYVLYESVDAATSACKEMRGVKLGGPDHRIRVDFADESHMPTTKALTPKRVPSMAGDLPQRTERKNEKDSASVDLPHDKGRRSCSKDYNTDKVDYQSDRPKREPRTEYESSERRKSDRGYTEKSTEKTTHKRSVSPEAKVRSADVAKSESHSIKRRRTQSPVSDVNNKIDSSKDAVSKKRISNSVSQAAELNVNSVESLTEIIKVLPVVWSGALVLKNSAFATKMHLVSGDVHLVDMLMRDQCSTELPLLKITQRLRLDQPKLEEVGRRVAVSGATGHAVLLAQPGSPEALDDANTNIQQRPLKNLVTYLKQKEAAGVISLPPTPSKDKDNIGVLHAFPPCTFGQEFLMKKYPSLGTEIPKEDHLVVIVVKGVA